MFKKSIFIIATILLCNTAQGSSEDQKTQTKNNQKNEIPEKISDNRYNVGTIIISTTAALAGAYVLDSLIRTHAEPYQTPLKLEGHQIVAIVGLVTAGAAIVEIANAIEKIYNPTDQKKPKLKTMLVQEGIKKVFNNK